MAEKKTSVSKEDEEWLVSKGVNKEALARCSPVQKAKIFEDLKAFFSKKKVK